MAFGAETGKSDLQRFEAFDRAQRLGHAEDGFPDVFVIVGVTVPQLENDLPVLDVFHRRRGREEREGVAVLVLHCGERSSSEEEDVGISQDHREGLVPVEYLSGFVRYCLVG